MSTIHTSEFDVAEYLDNEEMISEYLSVSLEDPNPDVFISALATVARAKGMTQLAKDTGLGRESLYKTLASGAKPRFETIMKISQALGAPLGIRHRYIAE
jgi:probable addiction module antidote protein